MGLKDEDQLPLLFPLLRLVSERDERDDGRGRGRGLVRKKGR
jgi:hypothetical protein